jgi:hypothetical protein
MIYMKKDKRILILVMREKGRLITTHQGQEDKLSEMK